MALGHHRFEWLYVTAFVSPESGETFWYLSNGVSKAFFEELLALFAREAGAGHKRFIILLIDGAGWHKSKTLELPENITLLLLPPYSPELNGIERMWAYLRSHYLSHRVFKDYQEWFGAEREAWLELSQSRLQSICQTSWITPPIHV